MRSMYGIDRDLLGPVGDPLRVKNVRTLPIQGCFAPWASLGDPVGVDAAMQAGYFVKRSLPSCASLGI